jgi:hypothetical protein
MLDVSRLLCDEDITPSDAKLGGEEDQPGCPSPNGGPIKLKLESTLDLEQYWLKTPPRTRIGGSQAPG